MPNWVQFFSDEATRRASFSQANRPSNNQSGGVFLYALHVIDPTTQEILQTFGFDVPPQSISRDSEFAEEAVASQDGGYWIDGRGQYFKILSVSGTFGYRPSARGAIATPLSEGGVAVQGAVVQPARPLFATDEVTGKDRQEAFERLFTFYAQRKQRPSLATRTLLLWEDARKGQTWIAQPQREREERSVPSGKFQSKYSFTLRLLEPYSWKDTRRSLFLDEYVPPLPSRSEGTQEKSLRQKASMSSLKASYESLSNTLAQAKKTLAFLLSVPKTAINSLFAMLEQSLEAVRSVFSFGLEISRLPKQAALFAIQTFESLSQSFVEIGRGFLALPESLWPLDDPFLLSLPGRIASECGLLFGDLQKTRSFFQEPERSPQSQGIAPPREALPESSLRSSSPSVQSGFLFARVQVSTWSDFLKSHPNVDASEVIKLNRLRFPYISRDGDGVHVLKPQSFLKIPSSLAPRSELKKVSENARLLAWWYGIDLKQEASSDLAVSQGDLAIVSGVENLKQALLNRFLTPLGALPLHPTFGFPEIVGEGIRMDRASRAVLLSRVNLLNDARIEQVTYLQSRLEGETIQIQAQIRPRPLSDQAIERISLQFGISI